jgi:hypothetical protein
MVQGSYGNCSAIMARWNFVLGGYYSYERGLDFTPSMALQTPGATASALPTR